MPYCLQRAFAVLAFLLLAPLMSVIASLIRAIDGKPVLFRQTRIGLDETPFQILKFRTMVNNADEIILRDPNANRLTKTGKLLRRTGMDELPQLVNVIRGDMAGIGPRAVLPEVARNLPMEYRQRFSVLPGLTGLAQVRGRNDLLWSRRLAADVEYVHSRSCRTDALIALRTVFVLIRGVGFKADRNTPQVDDLGLLRG